MEKQDLIVELIRRVGKYFEDKEYGRRFVVTVEKMNKLHELQLAMNLIERKESMANVYYKAEMLQFCLNLRHIYTSPVPPAEIDSLGQEAWEAYKRGVETIFKRCRCEDIIPKRMLGDLKDQE